jgi:hypothetical protein
MLKIYVDTEFLEGTQKRRLLYVPLWNTKPTIDLISIGLVNEKGDKEYYGICKDFNLREAWYRHDKKYQNDGNGGGVYKVYWIRDNVLKKVFEDLVQIDLKDDQPLPAKYHRFTLRNMRSLLDLYGQSKVEIAEEVKQFVYQEFNTLWIEKTGSRVVSLQDYIKEVGPVRFCGYYSDYDWVVFCWLFGKMMDLPTSSGFPMYCYDLKQKLDDVVAGLSISDLMNYQLKNSDSAIIQIDLGNVTFKDKLKVVKRHHLYPENNNDHSAKDDSYWNRNLDLFIDRYLK